MKESLILWILVRLSNIIDDKSKNISLKDGKWEGGQSEVKRIQNLTQAQPSVINKRDSSTEKLMNWFLMSILKAEWV